MMRPTAPEQAIHDFWVKPLRAEPLALFRILSGALIVISLLTSLAPEMSRYLGKDGLCPSSAGDDWLKRSWRFSLLRGPVDLLPLERVLPPRWAAAWSNMANIWAAWGDTAEAAWMLFFLWLVALASLTVGRFTRLSAILSWALAVTFHNRLSWVLNGGDALFRTALFYLMIAPSGAAWSLDRWRKKDRAEGPVLIPAWSVRLMQIQICLIYLATGLSKINITWGTGELGARWIEDYGDWLNGEALYWVLNDVALARWPYAWLPVPMWLCRLASWGTLAFEIGFPLFMMIRPLRPWVLALGVSFHLGIWATTEVGWFSWMTLSWYALFLTPETAERILRWMTGWFYKTASPAAGIASVAGAPVQRADQLPL